MLLSTSHRTGDICASTSSATWPRGVEWVTAALSLQGKPHEPFGTPNVQATAQSVLRRIGRETGLDLAALERRLTAMRL